MIQTKPVIPPPYYREELWKRFSRFYDLLVKFVLLPLGGESKLRKKLIALANPGNGEQVLDVCCGTGTLTSLLAQRVGASGGVIGVDLSAAMLRVAKEKVKASIASLLKVNAEHLPFPDDIFDKAFLSLGLHEMPRIARGNTLREIYRTLKFGGSLFVLEYHLPQSGLGQLAIKAFLRLFEEEAAYQMLLRNSLSAEIKEVGFALARCEFLYGGIFQIVQARKQNEEFSK